jgi:hypothetical protein
MHSLLRRLRLFPIFFAVALLASACAPAEEDRPALTIGSVNFDENVIVAAMYAEVLEEAGYQVNRRFLLGTREVVLPAAEGGEIDLFPEYVGSAVEFLEPGTATADTQATTEALRRGIVKQVSRGPIWELLHEGGLKPWREKNVVRSGDNPLFRGQNGRRSGGVPTSSESQGTGGLPG